MKLVCEYCDGHGYIETMSVADNAESIEITCGECEGKGEINQMIKKYYVGARHIAHAISQGQNATCMHIDENDAIAEAKEKIEDGDVECAVVVEIKYVIRRERPPVKVERI